MKYKAAATISIAAMVAIAFVACSADVEVALDETVTTEAEAPAEEQVDETVDAGESENDAEVETTTTTEEMVDSTIGESEPAEDADDEAPSTTIPPTTTTTELPAEEEIVEELELIEILGLGIGGGSGERVLYLGPIPDGLQRIKVSVSGPDGYCNASDFDWGGDETGGSITWLDSPALDCEYSTDTVGVAWVHQDGRRSGISYHPLCSVSLQPSELC
ncbi:MAG: hypothetical protein VW442_04360 [Acidimicrobiaceae bacterium]|jgi:hypothetical protein